MNQKILREAILDVIDDGDLARTARPSRFRLRWRLYDSDEASANAQRLDFAQAVLDRYAVLARNTTLEKYEERVGVK